MKFSIKYIWGAAAILAITALFTALSFDRTSNSNLVEVDENGSETEYFVAPKAYQRVYARDTMSAAGNTTVDIPWPMVSPYQYNYYIRLRKLQHTPNVKVVLREANSTGSTLWSPIDSVTCSAADSTKVHFRLRGTTVYGARHQLLFVKTGTTTVQRDIILNIKPPNQ